MEQHYGRVHVLMSFFFLISKRVTFAGTVRLPEDLSPFMYEVPRYFGPLEGFFKEVCVAPT